MEKLISSEKYDKINEYFDFLFEKINVGDSFIIDNLPVVLRFSDAFLVSYNKKIKRQKIVNTEFSLSYEDLISLTREIINDIDIKTEKKFLKTFDEILDNGHLDIQYVNKLSSYEKMYYDSCMFFDRFNFSKDNSDKHIYLKRTYNYSDVVTLIHEFFHYLDVSDERNNFENLSEGLSIFFESYATNYLVNNKNIDITCLIPDFRLNSTSNLCRDFNDKYIPLICYQTYGKLSDDVFYNFVESRFCDEETYIYEINNFYDFIVDLEQGLDNNLFLTKNFFVDCVKFMKYLYGVMFAYYAIDKGYLKEMVNMIDYLKDNTWTSNEILKTIGLDFERMSNNCILYGDYKEIHQLIYHIFNYINKLCNYSLDNDMYNNSKNMTIVKKNEIVNTNYKKTIIGVDDLDNSTCIILSALKRTIAINLDNITFDETTNFLNLNEKLNEIIYDYNLQNELFELRIIPGTNKNEIKFIDGKVMDLNSAIIYYLYSNNNLNIISCEIIDNNSSLTNVYNDRIEVAFDSIKRKFVTKDVYFGDTYKRYCLKK